MPGKSSKNTNRKFEKGKMFMTEKGETILPKKKLLSPKPIQEIAIKVKIIIH